MTNMLERYLQTLNKNLVETGNKFVSDMQKNYKVLVQNLSGKKADYKDLVKIYNDLTEGNEKALEQTPYQKELVFC